MLIDILSQDYLIRLALSGNTGKRLVTEFGIPLKRYEFKFPTDESALGDLTKQGFADEEINERLQNIHKFNKSWITNLRKDNKLPPTISLVSESIIEPSFIMYHDQHRFSRKREIELYKELKELTPIEQHNISLAEAFQRMPIDKLENLPATAEYLMSRGYKEIALTTTDGRRIIIELEKRIATLA